MAQPNISLQGQSQATQDMANFALNLRKTALGIKIGRKLFSPGAGGLSPRDVTNLLKAIGLKIPPGVEVTVDVAQLLIAGGAVVEGAETAASINQVVNNAGGAANALIALLDQMGMPNETAMQCNIVIDVGMIASSAGFNLYAWVKLAIDTFIYGYSMDKVLMGRVMRDAYASSSDWKKRTIEGQIDGATKNFMLFAVGKLSTFRFVSAIAMQSPELFESFFPELGMFIPPTVGTRCFKKEGKKKILGIQINSRSFTSCVDFKTYADRSPQQFADSILSAMVEPVLRPYTKIINQDDDTLRALDRKLNHYNPVRRIDVNTLCLLAMLPPYKTSIPTDFDVRKELLSKYLTPHDFTKFDDDCIPKELLDPASDFYKDTIPVLRQGVSGAASFATKSEIAEFNAKTFIKNTANAMLYANEIGDIKYLLKNPISNAIISEWGRIVPRDKPIAFRREIYQVPALRGGGMDTRVRLIPYTIPEVDFLAETAYNVDSALKFDLDNDPTTPEETLLGSVFETRKNLILGGGWRNMENYYAALSLLDMLMQDEYFVNNRAGLDFQWVQQLEDFDEMYKETYTKMVMRQSNEMALANIAFFFNTTPDKLKNLSKPENGETAVFVVKTVDQIDKEAADKALKEAMDDPYSYINDPSGTKKRPQQ